MNGQLQVFNPTDTAGAANWEIKFDSNYDITQFNVQTPLFTSGAIQQTDNGNTYSYVIPITGSIGAFNQNVQIGIVGVRHPNSTDTSASHSNAVICA